MSFLYVLRLSALVQVVVATFMFFPAGIAYYDRDMDSLISFAISIAVILFCCAAYFFATHRLARKVLSPRDGFLFVTSSWVIASFSGALPFFISGAIPSFTDAYFETMSGFTTTGASILGSIEAMPRCMLFWRSLTHWLGGMGIVVLVVAVLPLLGVGGARLVGAESPGPQVDKFTPRITNNAKILWLIYVGLSCIEFLLLMAGGMSVFDSLTHTFGTMATGGFSNHTASIGYYDSAYLDGVITTFMVLAGTNFVLYYKMLRGRLTDIFKDGELRLYLAIFGVTTLIITLILSSQGSYSSIGQAFRYASFQVATILTTTGYATANFELWPNFARSLLLLLMLVGGCSGSTGGGIKVIRIASMFKLWIGNIKYMLHPRGVFSIKVGRTTIPKSILYTISGFFGLYIMTVVAVAVVVASGGYDLLTSLSSALATVGNIGPGFGGVGPAESYSHFPGYIKWVLSLAMMAGRLELFTVFALITPQFWKR